MLAMCPWTLFKPDWRSGLRAGAPWHLCWLWRHKRQPLPPGHPGCLPWLPLPGLLPGLPRGQDHCLHWGLHASAVPAAALYLRPWQAARHCLASERS